MGSPNSKDDGGRARLSGDGERSSFGFSDSGSSHKVLSFDESGQRARVELIEDHYEGGRDEGPGDGSNVQTQVIRSVGEDGSVVTKTVRTTRRTALTDGVATTTVEVQTTTETESKDGAKSTSVATETHTEIGGGTLASEAEEKAPAVHVGETESEREERPSVARAREKAKVLQAVAPTICVVSGSSGQARRNALLDGSTGACACILS
ncbi:unnamed protein product [Phytophthora fragariaefolia]|uniref:Unnamed protein product n=1 Tax=Phytophthora fragariaefolia TaxID=1490495 RepID=A0A9W6YC22_9STRA|nr:unnamed protein product [Phytophthora fragariaefolia]